jgi:hypothetical protein
LASLRCSSDAARRGCSGPPTVHDNTRAHVRTHTHTPRAHSAPTCSWAPASRAPSWQQQARRACPWSLLCWCGGTARARACECVWRWWSCKRGCAAAAWRHTPPRAHTAAAGCCTSTLASKAPRPAHYPTSGRNHSARTHARTHTHTHTHTLCKHTHHTLQTHTLCRHTRDLQTHTHSLQTHTHTHKHSLQTHTRTHTHQAGTARTGSAAPSAGR